jgi:hypothetical protein
MKSLLKIVDNIIYPGDIVIQFEKTDTLFEVDTIDETGFYLTIKYQYKELLDGTYRKLNYFRNEKKFLISTFSKYKKLFVSV